jgi:hypothetical protein
LLRWWETDVRALTGAARGGRERNWMSRIKRVSERWAWQILGRRGAVRRRTAELE